MTDGRRAVTDKSTNDDSSRREQAAFRDTYTAALSAARRYVSDIVESHSPKVEPGRKAQSRSVKRAASSAERDS